MTKELKTEETQSVQDSRSLTLTVYERLKAIIAHYKITTNAFCVSIGITRASINQLANNKMLKNGNYPSVGTNVLASIIEHYPEVSSMWLLTGRGNMIDDTSIFSQPDMIQAIDIPGVFSASATFGENTEIAGMKNMRKVWVEKPKGMKENAILFRITISGDSMQPTIADGAKVLIRVIDRGDWQYMGSGVYVIDYAEKTVCKRVKDNTILEKHTLQLHSDNDNHGSETVLVEDIRGIFRVEQILNSKVL